MNNSTPSTSFSTTIKVGDLVAHYDKRVFAKNPAAGCGFVLAIVSNAIFIIGPSPNTPIHEGISVLSKKYSFFGAKRPYT